MVFPLPVSPAMITTGFIRIASTIACSSAKIGKSILLFATESRRFNAGTAPLSSESVSSKELDGMLIVEPRGPTNSPVFGAGRGGLDGFANDGGSGLGEEVSLVVSGCPICFNAQLLNPKARFFGASLSVPSSTSSSSPMSSSDSAFSSSDSSPSSPSSLLVSSSASSLLSSSSSSSPSSSSGCAAKNLGRPNG